MQFPYPPATSKDASTMKRILVAFITFLPHVQMLQYDPSLGFQYSTPEECNRVCADGEAPKLCYYHFTIEFYPTVSKACDAGWEAPGCIRLDGVEKMGMFINRKLPGDPIRVCRNDKVVIDVHNKAEGTGIAIHWHGLWQNGFQIYDGVPFVTQCPIHGGNTFRYDFVAANSGTHFYHSHSATYEIDGVYGSFIVRDPPSQDPMRRLYDKDLPEHEIVLSDLFHELSLDRLPGRYRNRTGQSATNFLINGKGNWTDPVTKETTNAPLATFKVQKGLRYRLRVISAFGTVCGSRLSIQNHDLLIIAQDGENIVPTVVRHVYVRSGERVDVILNANQRSDAYWIELAGSGECAETNVKQYGILKYEGANDTPRIPNSNYNAAPGVAYNSQNGFINCAAGNTGNICVSSLQNAEPVPRRLLEVYPDQFFLMNIGYFDYTNRTELLFGPGRYDPFFVVPDRSHVVSLMAGRSFEGASAPLTSQREGYETICEGNRKPRNCPDPCFCTTVYRIKKDSLVEILIYDVDPANLSHPLHLHGYSFNVLDMGTINGTPTQEKIEGILTNHIQRLKRGEYKSPPGKDTISVPRGGYVIMRFIADNPGWWFFHCHFLWHTITGMNVILYVGDEGDIPRIPRSFPRCNDWTPPVY